MTLKRNILASWLAHAITLVIGLYLMPFILHTMGEESYGVWVFVSSIAGYSGLLYMGFGATICKYVAQETARENWEFLSRVVSTIFCFYLGTAVTVLLAAAAFAACVPWLNVWGNTPPHQVQWAILILGLSTASGMIGSVYGGILVGTQRFDVKRAIEVATAITRVVLVVLFLRREYGIVVLASVFLAITLLEQALYVFCARRVAPQIQVRISLFSRKTFKECASFSSYTALGGLSESLIYMTDTVVIGSILGATAVVPYYIGLRLCQMIRLPIEQIAEVVLPRAGQLHAKGETAALHRLLSLGMGLNLLLTGSFLIGAVYFGELLIETWVGPGYAVSYQILVLLLSAQVIALPMHVVRKTLLGAGSVKLSSVIDLTEAFCNLVLSLILIQRFGVIGVAWGTLLPLVVIELGVLLPCAAKQLGLPVSRMLRDCVLHQLFPLAALLGYSAWVSRYPLEAGWLTLIPVSAGGGVVLAAAWWLQRSMMHARRSPNAHEPQPEAVAAEPRDSAAEQPQPRRVVTPLTVNR